MPLYCVGLSHKTAPVALRERFAVAEADLPSAMARVRAAAGLDEIVWLSTCNRVELYLVGEPARAEAARHWLFQNCHVDDETAGGAVYSLGEPESVAHLFRVASGLDSMVLGETEILGQLKKAYETARQHGHTAARLNRAFQRAFHIAKQIRSQTNIQRGGISVASVAVELAEHIFESVEGRHVLVLGAGDTGEKVARALLSRGAAAVQIWNRSVERGRALAETLGPRAASIPDWPTAATSVDIIITSTAAQGVILDFARVSDLMIARRHRPLLLIDLAVPRDVEPSVISLSDVYLFNVDDLQAIADSHLRKRQAEMERCESIIQEKVAALLNGGAGPRLVVPGSSEPMLEVS